MPIKALPEHGLELSLDEYSKLRAFQGGGWYWDHHHQQTIRECLGEFLPRVEQTGAGALFQHFVGGKEAAAGSRPVALGGDHVPKGELQRLHQALERLKRKAAAPETDRDARRVIESFALPDPSKDPELYRLYGPPWRRRLLVLWGCEREPGTSVAPFAALNRMPVEPESTTWLRRWPLLLGALLLLLLLLLLAYLLWPRGHDRSVSSTNPPATIAANGSTAPAPVPSAPTATDASADSTSSSTVPVVLPTVDPAGSNRAAAGAQSSAVHDPPDATERSSASSRDKEGAASSTTTTSDISAPGATAPNNAASRSAAAHESSPKPGAATSPPRATSSNDSQSSRGQSPPSSRSGATSTSSTDVPGAPPVAPDSSPSKGPAKLNVTASYAAAPRNGKVDVSLAAVVERSDKQSVSFSVTEWRVDGGTPPEASRSAPGDNRLKLSLPEGTHRVRVSGTADAVAMTTEVEMDVQIHSQSDVKVKPGASP